MTLPHIQSKSTVRKSCQARSFASSPFASLEGVDEIVPKLRRDELEQVIKLVGRSPSCNPPGTLDAVSSLLLVRATMSQDSPLRQSAHSVRRALTAYKITFMCDSYS
jgi:hypothetical protein